MLFGIILNKKIGDAVKKGEVLAYIHANNEEKATLAVEDLKFAFKVTDKKVIRQSSIIDIIE